MGLKATGGGSGSSSLVPGTTVITGGTDGRILYDNAGVLGEATGIVVAAGAVTTILGTTVTASTQMLAPAGTASAPGLRIGTGTTHGIYEVDVNNFGVTIGSSSSAPRMLFGLGVTAGSADRFGWSNSGSDASTPDTQMARASVNSIVYGGASVSAGAATSRTEINKAITGIADATATAVFTVTVPNAAHSASIRVRLTGSLGAGGAIGANESTQDAEYMINIARTTGVNAVATIGAVVGQAAAASVAGANNAAVTGDLSAISGAVGVANTFTVRVTITKSGGASAAHTCIGYAELLNANASGVTIS